MAVVLCAVALVGIAVVLFDTVAGIVDTWYGNVTFNHGFLIIPICAYLAWLQRATIARTPIAPDVRGLIVVALAAFGWWLGFVGGVVVVQQFALVLAFDGAVFAMLGWPMVSALRFPLFYLYFAVPFGVTFIPPLQDITAYFAVSLLHLVGVPIFVDGNIINTPTGNFVVAEACSGIRYLIASVALGVLLAGLMYRTWARRILFLAISVVVPIIANGIRAFGIVLIAYLTNNEYATGVDHIIYGWVFFSLVTFLVLAAGMALRDDEGEGEAPIAPAATVRMPAISLIFAGIVAVGIVASSRLYADYVDRPQPPSPLSLSAPNVSLPWRVDGGAPDPSRPVFHRADAELHRAYVAGDGTVHLDVGYFVRQRRGAEAVSYEHKMVGGENWTGGQEGLATATLDGRVSTVNSVRGLVGRHGRLVWYWYWVDGRFVANAYAAKLLQVKVKLVGGNQAAAIIAVNADYGQDPTAAETALRDFLDHVPAIETTLLSPRQP